MKASELIAELATGIAEHGDGDVIHNEHEIYYIENGKVTGTEETIFNIVWLPAEETEGGEGMNPIFATIAIIFCWSTISWAISYKGGLK